MSKLTKEKRTIACKELLKAYPDAKCELDYDTPYHLLVAVMLSAQTTDKGVNKITPELFKAAPDAEAMCSLSIEELENHIKKIGLYRNKAKNIMAMSGMLLSRHGGQVPDNYNDLIQLPGVGRKTANVVLAEAFGQQRIAVDTHVFRLANRIGFTEENNVLQTELSLMKVLPEELWTRMHHALIIHGRRCCKAVNPDCENCCIENICKKNGLNCVKKGK